ncbi:heterokaryon incompatibility protein-domain-containing protein [Xylaria acuta]|nr:heterokaryon incompatibility protein-domain-containing protein [Xylaria acuta]
MSRSVGRCRVCRSGTSTRWPYLDPGPVSPCKRKPNSWQRGADAGCSFCFVVMSVVRDAKDPRRITAEHMSHMLLVRIQTTLLRKNGKAILEIKRVYYSGPMEIYHSWAGKILVYPESDVQRTSMFYPYTPIPKSARSSRCFALAQKWLSHCRENHAKCASVPRPYVPKRLVSIKDMRIHLCEYLNGPIQYVALSHCWGGNQPLKTTSTTLDAYRSNILFDDLPLTFQHALTVARRLGFDYIWIDSLCIIQDNRQDWEEQSGEMALVYRGAELVLGATAAYSADAGFLHDRITKTQKRLQLRLPGRKTMSSIHYRTFKGAEHGANGPLESRGWAYQERVIARRFLSYGLNEIVWDCMEDGDCECDCVHDSSPTDDWHVENLEKGISGFHRKGLMAFWRNSILSQYSHRFLTVPSDALVALSAVASLIHELDGGLYFAGLWSQDLLRGLMWFCSKPCRTQSFYAPSWSWASLMLVEDSWLRHCYSSSDESGDEIASITAVDVQPTTTNQFGNVEYGMINVRGKCIHGILTHNTDGACGSGYKIKLLHETLVIGDFLFIDSALVAVEYIQPDGTKEVSARRALSDEIAGQLDDRRFTVRLLLILRSRSKWFSENHKKGWYRTLYGALILTRSATGPGEFQRIGVCEIRTEGEERDTDGAYDKLETRDFRII